MGLEVISDVVFNSNRVDPSTFTVKLLDHSGLGGPMGSERVSQIESWTFAKSDLALKFAKLLIERLAKNDSRIDPERDVKTLFEDYAANTREGYAALVDLLSVGVSIVRNKGDIIIQSFTYDQPTVARVTA
jgi:hypothetical protein